MTKRCRINEQKGQWSYLIPGDNVQIFLSSFANMSTTIERGLGIDLCAFGIDGIYESMG